jgi:two-component system, NarL family, response regulator DesR
MWNRQMAGEALTDQWTFRQCVARWWEVVAEDCWHCQPGTLEAAVPSPARILVVDDNACSRDGLCALLATLPDLEIVGTAANGADAVRLTEQWQPDVVLMDARMPVMDGLEATRQIKAHFPHVKVIVMSMSAAYRSAAEAAGADLFLVKGSPSEDLVAAVSPAASR